MSIFLVVCCLTAALILPLLCEAVESTSSVPIAWKYPLAGGLAGGLSNAIIYPIDTIKTILQTNKNVHGTGNALNTLRSKGLQKLYSGSIPAIIGSIPSSALYFGTYETVKSFLKDNYQDKLSLPFIHMLSASSGNIASSFVFVPKETVKQQLQAYRGGTIPWLSANKITVNSVCRTIWAKKGILGFYPSYRATLARNIPSAIVSSIFAPLLQVPFMHDRLSSLLPLS